MVMISMLVKVRPATLQRQQQQWTSLHLQLSQLIALFSCSLHRAIAAG
jgi:hypothetical protein